eukprot:7128588-Prymnesium_polylepis.2
MEPHRLMHAFLQRVHTLRQTMHERGATARLPAQQLWCEEAATGRLAAHQLLWGVCAGGVCRCRLCEEGGGPVQWCTVDGAESDASEVG